MTSLSGFLYSQCDEYELSSCYEPSTTLDDHEKFLEKYNKAIDDDEIHIFLQSNEDVNFKHRDIIKRGEGFKKRLIIRQFLIVYLILVHINTLGLRIHTIL